MKYIKLNKKGFTLVEIMVALAIVVILAGVIIPNIFTSRQKAQLNTCLANIRQMQGALDTAILLENTETANLTQGEIENVTGPTAPEGGFLKKMPKCPSDGVYSTDSEGIVHCTVHAPGEEPEPEPS